jgi:ATP-binding cassette subfamily F protein 3
VGPNGAGKTTLLKLLVRQGDEQDDGEIRRGTNLEEGFFDQHLGTLDPTRTAVEQIRSVRGDLNVDGARQYLSRFRFYGDDPLRKVSGLSGGERSRLALAKLLLEPRNLLLLDEPTNHLDIPAAEILEEALLGFEGTVLLISHDRRFLENVATRVVSLRDGQCDVYPGGFRDFVEASQRLGPACGATADALRSGTPERAEPAEPSYKTAAKAAFEQGKAEARAAERKRKRIGELEDLIAAAEGKVNALRDELRQHPGGDWVKVADLARQEQALSRRIEAMLCEWSALSEEGAGERGGLTGGNRT